MRSKGIFITATGTDIGKTFVTGLIVKKLCEAGYRAGYYKAVLSGAQRTENGLHIGDAYHVKTTAKLNMACADMVSYVYETAASPHLAAKLEGNPPVLEKIVLDYQKLCAVYDYITVEGSGGIICPIRYDNEQQLFLEDIIKRLELDVIIVADSGLGTINATVLTARYLESKNIQAKGIIFNHYQGCVLENDNIEMVKHLTGLPVIALVRNGDTDLEIDVGMLEALYRKGGQ